MIRTLKILIDILFRMLCIGFIGFFLILPFGVFTTKIADVSFMGYEGFGNLPVFYWIGIGLSIATYILFLVALNYLRRTMNHLISTSTYTIEVSANLKWAGIFFVVSAMALSFTYVVFWGIDLTKGNIKLILGTDIMVPLFLCIVGCFFMLQSRILNEARFFKEDSNLTI